MADLFDMQDEIVARLAGQLEAQLIAAEARRAERTPNPDSTGSLFSGNGLVQQGSRPPKRSHRRVVSFSVPWRWIPAIIDAMVGAAFADAVSANTFFTDDRDERLCEAEGILTKTLSLAPNHAYGPPHDGHGSNLDQSR